jgi:hypothetical protein
MKKLLFGKNPKKEDDRNLMFSTYSKELPPPPQSYDNLAKVYNNLKINNPAKLFPLLGNDAFGDCTIAGISHADTVYNGLIGKKSIASRSSVLKLYNKLTGGIDSGLPELTVLNYWRQNKCFGDKIIAYTEINPKNHIHIQQAIQLFGGVYIGFNVQENCQKDFRNKITWTPGKLTGHGHAVYLTSYDQETVTILTWGNMIKGTYAWLDETCDEAYAIVPPELVTNELLADLMEVTK